MKDTQEHYSPAHKHKLLAAIGRMLKHRAPSSFVAKVNFVKKHFHGIKKPDALVADALLAAKEGKKK